MKYKGLKTLIILTAVLLAACAGYSQFSTEDVEILSQNFETNKIGSQPPASYIKPTSNTTTNHITVISTNTNPIGTGNAIQFFDDSIGSTELYYDFIYGAFVGEPAIRIDFDFCPLETAASRNDAVSSDTNDAVNIGIMAHGVRGNSTTTRYAELTFYPGSLTNTNVPDHAVLRPRSNGMIISNNVGVGYTNQYNVSSGQVYNISMFLNDGTSQLTYCYIWGGITNFYTLPGDSVDYWVNGTLLATNAQLRSSLATNTTSGFGRFGFNSGATTSSNINVVVDNLKITCLGCMEVLLPWLQVNNGLGSRYAHPQTQVAIAANVYSGKTFVAWTGEVAAVACVDNVTNALAFVTMSASDITLTATFTNSPGWYTLTVNSGYGDGSYTNGTVVPICADDPPPGMVFFQWVGDTAYLADSNAACTTLAMPASNITLTATYVYIYYTLTVNSGSGDGSYTNGQQVAIKADDPPPYQIFLRWRGDTQYLSDINSSSTTVTMPATNVTVAADYRSIFPPVDPNLDSDGDGLKDWEEYIAGTDPTNATSCFKAAQSNRNVVTWTPTTGRLYSVYWSTNLMKGFTALNTNIPYSVSSYTNATPASKMNYYQIKVRLAE